MTKRYGLILTGGAARGAYQVGVIKGLFKIFKEANIEWPFQVITMNSAGAINGCYFLSKVDWNDPAAGWDELESLWKNIRSSDIYKTSWLDVMLNGASWLKSLTMSGGGKKKKRDNLSLLEPDPLYELIKKNVDFKKVNNAVTHGPLDTFSINTLSYCDGYTKTYFHSRHKIKEWKRLKREAINMELNSKHLLASSAIPIIFPPVKVDGGYHCDGSVRDYAPLSPSIHFGCEKLFIVGTRMSQHENYNCNTVPTTARIINMIIDSLLQDSLPIDLERLELINNLVKNNPDSNMRPIDSLFIKPSIKIADIAAKHFDTVPRAIKYLVKGLGGHDDVTELISYILFEKDYVNDLIALGEEDIASSKNDVLSFFQK